MKKLFSLLLFFALIQVVGYGQQRYGKTLNFGVGIGYYGYAHQSMPVLHLNYELDAAKNFTLAPFISVYSYRNRYWGGSNKKYNNYYTYRETVVPIGVKGTYYFDSLLKANAKWDFYLAGSLGFALRRVAWHEEYEGDRDIYRGANPLYLDLHIGAEYHINNKLGLFLDLSSGTSTLGLAFH